MKLQKKEKIFLVSSLVVLLLSSLHLSWLFYSENSQTLASEGGIYTEGVLGKVNFINPILAQPNSLDADLVALIYSGLTKYDPRSGKIVPDIATFTVDPTNKIYTFVLKDAYWHDGEKVTADDVLFTYKELLQNPDFPEPILGEAFKDIVIEKTDERTVRFQLKEPYYFFPTATTLGILPKHIWSDWSPDRLSESDFNMNPVGSGSYRFSRIKNEGRTPTVELERFEQYYDLKPKIKNIVFEIFPSSAELVANLSRIDAADHVPSDALAEIRNNKRFSVFPYSLPQYAGVFLNNAHPVFADKRVRLALLLATNKDAIVQTAGDAKRVDTPFLELKNASWQYQYDPAKAQGALFDAGWKLPGSGTNQNGNASSSTNTNTNVGTNANLSNRNASNSNAISYQPVYYVASNDPVSPYRITEPNNGKSFTTKETYFILRGTNPKNATGLLINNYELKKFTASKGTWSYIASLELGTLKKGSNTYSISYLNESGKKVFLDSITITYDPAGTPPTQPNQNRSIPPTTSIENKNMNTAPAILASTSNTNQGFALNKNNNTASSANNTNFNGQALSSNQNSPSTAVNTNGNQPTANINKNTNVSSSTTLNANANVANTPAPIPADLISQIRVNAKGEPLRLKMVTASSPGILRQIAEQLRESWLEAGIYTDIEVLNEKELLEVIRNKNYDIILYGQSLGYNLDTFPYWHSSQGGENGFNLSNFKSFQADTLLEEIRNPFINKGIDTNNPEKLEASRQENLQKLVAIFEENNPAIFLYQPIYYYAVDTKKLKSMEIGNMALFSDRFEFVKKAYIAEQQILKDPLSVGGVFGWLWKNL